MAVPEIDARFPVFHDGRNHDWLKVSPFLTPKIKIDSSDRFHLPHKFIATVTSKRLYPENFPTCSIFSSPELIGITKRNNTAEQIPDGERWGLLCAELAPPNLQTIA
jgi:hypothetical protein